MGSIPTPLTNQNKEVGEDGAGGQRLCLPPAFHREEIEAVESAGFSDGAESEFAMLFREWLTQSDYITGAALADDDIDAEADAPNR